MMYWRAGHMIWGVKTRWRLKVVLGGCGLEPVKSFCLRTEVMTVFCVSNMCVRLTLRRCQSSDRPYEAHKDSEHVLIAEVGNDQIAALWCADVITLWHATGIILWHKVIICRDWNVPYSSQLKRVICSAHGTLWSYVVREMKKRVADFKPGWVAVLAQRRRNWEGDWKIVEEDLG